MKKAENKQVELKPCSNSSWCSVSALLLPIIAVPLSIVAGVIIARTQGWTEFSFATVVMVGLIGIALGMIVGFLLGILGLIRHEPRRRLAWIALILWPTILVLLLASITVG